MDSNGSNTDAKGRELTYNYRKTTPAEAEALARLMHEVGYAPQVTFGRGNSSVPKAVQRLLKGKIYALVQPWQGGKASEVQQYTLYVTDVTKETNGVLVPVRTKRNGWTRAARKRASESQKRRWALIHAEAAAGSK